MKRFIFLYCSLLLVILSCSKNKIKPQKKENPLLTKAYQYYDNEKTDSAYVYFNNAKEIALQQKDSLIASICLIQMSILAGDNGDHFGAQESALEALSYLDKKDTAQSSVVQSCLHELGLISSDLKEYDQAIDFFTESLSYSKNNNSATETKNALANAYRDQKDYKTSIKIQQEMLDQKIDSIEYARILSNLTYTKWLNNPNYNAQADLLKALSIRLKENDRRGLNASFSHLADYYEKKDPDSALLFADNMYRNSISNKDSDDQLDALQKLVKLSPPNETKCYFLRYQQLNDSIQTARRAAKNQFAVARYRTEKHKKDFLKAESENIKKQSKIFLQYLVLGFLFLVLVFSYLWYRRRQKTLKQEKELEVKNTALKYSKKVHDVVANGLYRVMTEIENREDIDKEHILDKIDDMYQKSRDISYDQPQTPNLHFNDKLTKLLQTFETATLKVVVLGNTAQLWEKVTTAVSYEVEHILQELLVNMDKHSQATEVTLQFEQIDNHINIYYTDNGIGLSKDIVFKNGLTNTGNRIAHIHGSLTFDTETEKGLNIKLSFPIS